jgi:DNA-binding NarL/FixJ family response regulator
VPENFPEKISLTKEPLLSYQEASPPGTKVQQRHRKFTPERIQQIKDLVARGTSCEQIAATIGVTVGSLKVTCLRLGISLRTTES